jgi:hypothetical protein
MASSSHGNQNPGPEGSEADDWSGTSQSSSSRGRGMSMTFGSAGSTNHRRGTSRNDENWRAARDGPDYPGNSGSDWRTPRGSWRSRGRSRRPGNESSTSFRGDQWNQPAARVSGYSGNNFGGGRSSNQNNQETVVLSKLKKNFPFNYNSSKNYFIFKQFFLIKAIK